MQPLKQQKRQPQLKSPRKQSHWKLRREKSYLFLQTLLIPFLLMDPHSCTTASVSSRFLHFSISISPEWWRGPSRNKIIAIFESANEVTRAKNGQLVLELFMAGSSRQGKSGQLTMPYTRLVNTSNQREKPAIRPEKIPDCDLKGTTNSIHLEVEVLSPTSQSPSRHIIVRAQNAVKYPLPFSLSSLPNNTNEDDLRVFFVRTFEGNPESGEVASSECQIRHQMEHKETSRFILPPTTPLPLPLPSNNSSAIDSFKEPKSIPSATAPAMPTASYPVPAATIPAIIFSSSSPPSAKTPNQWPYKRKRVKLPRRSTKTAQSFLSPSHYVPTGKRWPQRQQNSALEWPTMPTWTEANRDSNSRRDPIGFDGNAVHYGARNGPKTTTPVSYIDIIRDRTLYLEVQRSRTNEINSRWSYMFLVFMGCIAVLIGVSAVFALLMLVLLQCRPDPTKRKKNKEAKAEQRKAAGNGGTATFFDREHF